MTAPRLIPLDEPVGALGRQTRLLMGEELLKPWRRPGATTLPIIQALAEAAMPADRIGVMTARPGRLMDLIETGRDPQRRPGRPAGALPNSTLASDRRPPAN